MGFETQFKNGSSGIFYYGVESGYPDPATSAPAPALPASFFWGGSFTDVPNVAIDDGSQEKYGLGSNAAQAIVPGARTLAYDITNRLANKVFLQKCFFGSGGYRNIADLCLLTGHSNEFGDGASYAARYAKCNNGSISMGEGNPDITVATQFWALAEEDAAPITPSPSDLMLYGTPLGWNNITQILINNGTSIVDLRSLCSSVTFNWNHNLERCNTRPDSGASLDWRRGAYVLKPRTRQYGAELMFHSPDAKRFALGLINTATGFNSFKVVVDDTGSSIQGTTPRVFTLAAGAGRVRSSVRRGGPVTENLMSSMSLILSTLAVT